MCVDMFNRQINVGDKVVCNNLLYDVVAISTQYSIQAILTNPSKTTKKRPLTGKLCFRITPEEMLLLELTK